MKCYWIATGGLALSALALGAVSSEAKEEIDRIREKAAELASSLQTERFSSLAEGKESNLDRVYRDFDYLLKESKNEAVREALEGASDPDADRLRRLDAFLLDGRIVGPIAPNIDNANLYRRDTALSVGDREVDLRTIELALANEPDRGQRRIMYLASRDLLENFNVFSINLKVDLDKHAQEVAGKDYASFLAESWQIDPAEVEVVCRQVLDATKDEYLALLPQCVDAEFDGLSMEEFREYDRPVLLRARSVDGTFRSGKEIDVADKWLKNLGLGVKGEKKLRLKVESKPGMWPDASVFPIGNSADTRVSMVPMGGLRDYWELFGALGAANFHTQIDGQRPFEHQRLGAPLTPLVYASLFQSVLADPTWRDAYLEVEDAEAVARAARFRQLFEVRQNAARYVFQRQMAAGPEATPTAYAAWMQEALGYAQTSSEESNYLSCQDLHLSGLRTWAAVLAAQVEQKLASQFGEDWWSKGEAGKWLKEQWARGFEVPAPELGAALEIGSLDPAFLAAH